MGELEPAASGASPSSVRPKPRTRAVFVDRDGTLNPDLHYLADPERLELFRGVADGIRLLRAHGYRVICVTNQSGIERGFYTAAQVDAIHARLNEILRTQGSEVDAFYYCPHAPETGCLCRKPGTELFEQAQREWHIEFSTSAIIGDRAMDVEAGQKLGLVTVAVAPPGGGVALAEELVQHRAKPDLRADSFLGGVTRLLAIG